VIVPDLTNPQFSEIVKSLQERATQGNLTTLLADACEEATVESHLISSLVAQVDGIVLCGSRLDDDQLLEARKSLPLVLINRRVPGISAVTIDPNGLREAVHHLHGFGHRRIAYLGGPDISTSQQARLAAAREVADEFGIELVDLGSFWSSFSGGADAVEAVLDSGVTAVLTYNDLTALGMINRLADHGKRVPDDISIVGFNDLPLAALTQPSLTTVKFPRQEAGRAAVDLLRQVLDGGPDQEAMVVGLQTSLVVRNSTSAVAS
jgi:DNA-binding LacI/PurR family transcriptional regulator